MRRRTLLLAGALSPLTPRLAAAQSDRPTDPGTVDVLYAASLVNLMEHGIGHAFATATQGRFQGYAGGSNKLANEIKGQLRRGDVFISANPNVNDDLTGPANGNWVDWYVTFAQSPVVIGYNPASRFAADLKSQAWFDVLRQPGIRIGRTDPKLDPKGRLTIAILDKAAQAHNLPNLTRQVLGDPENPAQVFPEENLVGRLQSGQLDLGFFYSTETTDLKIPAIALPPEATLSAHYTATILRGARNPAGAARFIAFLLSPEGRQVMHRHGLDVTTPSVTGNQAAIPAPIRAALNPT